MKKTQNIIILFICFVFCFNGFLFSSDKPEIAKLEKGLLPPVLIKGDSPWILSERMMVHKVPGVSIAVIKDFKLHWTKGYGVTDITTGSPVTSETLFQAASISKPVTAMAALKKVQEGKLKLDENVNNFLVSWKLPENKWTAMQKVTIKHLLSHTGGVTVHGFRGYAPFEPIPSLVQLLDGAKPANSAPIRVDMEPGKRFRYAGGGYCILQQMLIDIEKQPFPVIMEKTVLKPLGMMHSSFQQPLPAEMQKTAASGHRSSGLRVPGKWHVYPEMAAAGLWTTSADLAKFAIEIQLSLKNKSNKVLSAQTTQQMLTPFISSNMGLGMAVWKPGESVYFEHSGGNEGFRCRLFAHKDKGYGAVVMTNSDNGPQLYGEILRGIANIYQWDDYLPPPYEIIEISPEKLKSLPGKYDVDSDHLLTISEENGKLYAQVTFSDKAEIFPISESKFIRRDQRVVYEFVKDPNTKKIVHIAAERNKRIRTYQRKKDDYTVPLELLLARQPDKALEAYRKLRKQNPKDPMLGGMRLLGLVEQLIVKGYLTEAIALLHLTAEFYPDFIKQLYNTLNNEIQLFLRDPMIPESLKQQLKEGYNQMLKKLGLKEIQ
ncbi:MAG: serine hydrolase [Candidatus Aminicenantes bacterium]|jgi:CubicO group peptidase (beta-lactamase class C family)